jgi:hypothetical protein
MAIRRRFWKKKPYKNCIRQLANENTPVLVSAKTALLVALQQKVGELVLSIIS